MRLYLVRHGEAVHELQDPKRPLSGIGVKEIATIAKYVSEKYQAKISRVFHSGKERAKQTAEIFADHLNVSNQIKETDNLKPMDDPQIWMDRLSEYHDDIMLVGHLPFMGKLTSLVLNNRTYTSVVDFPTGGIACFKRDEGTSMWSLEWTSSPDNAIEDLKVSRTLH